MNKKSLFITLIIIAIAVLGITEFAAISSYRAAKKLTEAVDKIQVKQGEMEGKLGEIEGKINSQENLNISQKFSDAELYESNPNILFNDKQTEETFGILDELGKKAVNMDVKALNRLVELSLKSDGVYAESIFGSLIDVLNKETGFFFKSLYKHEQRLFIYENIIATEGDYIDVEKIKNYEDYSKEFLDMLDAHKKKEPVL